VQEDEDMDSIVPKVWLDSEKDWVVIAKSCVAELIGTLFLVLVGCGSCYKADDDFVRIALAFGVTVATIAQSIGHVSGCHINPAVTFGLLFGQKIGLVKSILYILSQCIGAAIGAALLMAFTPGPWNLGNTGFTDINSGQAFGIEFFITFVLVLVVYASAADEHNAPSVKGSAPLAIGLSITTCHLFAIPLTGSSMNPARSFGTAVISATTLGSDVASHGFYGHWVYWIGPILGGITAALVYQMLFRVVPLEDKKEYTEVPLKDVKDNEA